MRCLTDRRVRHTVPFLVFSALLALAVQVQAKPNFTGSWKLNVAKSDFGPMPAPDKRTDKIAHEEPVVKVSTTTVGQQGEFTYDMAYKTDGSESVNSLRGNEFKSVAKWEGDKLVINTKGSFGGNEFSSKSTWSMSEDGKSFTVESHFTSAMGEADTRQVFDKE